MIYATIHETEAVLLKNLQRMETAARLVAASALCAQADPTLSGSQDDLLRALIPLIHGAFETCVRGCEMSLFTALVDQRSLLRSQTATSSSDPFLLVSFKDKLKSLDPVNIIRAYQGQLPSTHEVDTFFLELFRTKLLNKSYSDLTKLKNAFKQDYQIDLTFTKQEEDAFRKLVERRDYIVHNVDMIDTALITILTSPLAPSSSPPILLRDVSLSGIQEYLVMIRSLTQMILTATRARLPQGVTP